MRRCYPNVVGLFVPSSHEPTTVTARSGANKPCTGAACRGDWSCIGLGAGGLRFAGSLTPGGPRGQVVDHHRQPLVTNALLLATQCLRQHGLPNLPGPVARHRGPGEGADDPRQASPCRLPQVGGQPGHASLQHRLGASRALERLERGPLAPKRSTTCSPSPTACADHGISNFPDPNSQGGFNLAGTGINSSRPHPSRARRR